MPKQRNTFKFIGELMIPKDLTSFVKSTKNETGTWETIKANGLGIKESSNNNAFLDLSFGHSTSNNMIFTFSKDGNKLQVPFSDRLKNDIIDSVSDFRKITFNMEEDDTVRNDVSRLKYRINTLERKIRENNATQEDVNKREEYLKEYKEKSNGKVHEFITEYDAINFLMEHADELRNKKVKVTGDVEMSYWNGKYYMAFIPRSFEYAKKDIINTLELNLDIYFNENSLRKNDKETFLDAYLLNYNKNSKSDAFFVKTFSIKNEDQDVYDFILDMFSLEDKRREEKDKAFHLNCIANYHRGAEILSISEDDLTDNQKKMIKLGLATLDSFGDKKFGDNVEKVYIKAPVLSGEFAVGAKATPYSLVEFEKNVASNLGMAFAKKEELKTEVPKPLLDQIMNG